MTVKLLGRGDGAVWAVFCLVFNHVGRHAPVAGSIAPTCCGKHVS